MVDFSDKNLMVNYVPRTLGQAEFRHIFEPVGAISSCKLMVKRETNESLGYGFVSYVNPMHSDLAVEKLDGMMVEGKRLKVGLAKKDDTDANLYVSGLPAGTTDETMKEMFSQFGEVVQNKVLNNKGAATAYAGNDGALIGFVRFAKKADAEAAIKEMDFKSLTGGERRLTVRFALTGDKKNEKSRHDSGRSQLTSSRVRGVAHSNYPIHTGATGLQMKSMQSASLSNANPVIASALAQAGIACPHSSGHANVVTGEVYSLYVHGLPHDADESNLYELFCPFGGLLNVRPILDLQKENKPCKGFGFVNFRKYMDACHALMAMDGFCYEGKMLEVKFKDETLNHGPPPSANNMSANNNPINNMLLQNLVGQNLGGGGNNLGINGLVGANLAATLGGGNLGGANMGGNNFGGNNNNNLGGGGNPAGNNNYGGGNNNMGVANNNFNANSMGGVASNFDRGFNNDKSPGQYMNNRESRYNRDPY